MRPTASAGADGTAPSVQRLCAECEDKLQRQAAEDDEEELLQTKAAGRHGPMLTPETKVPVGAAMTGGGQPLPEPIRTYFEPRFGHDFGTVRIYTGQDAVLSARLLNAKAYTVGRHIVFGEGRFAPATEDGRSLLAHELTHTIQQGKGGDLSTAKLQVDSRPLATPEAKEKGEDEDPEAKIKRRPAITFSVVRSDRPAPIGVEGKRQACPAAEPAAQRHRELEATAAQIAGMDACTGASPFPTILESPPQPAGMARTGVSSSPGSTR